MRKSAARICCAFMLMGMALTSTVGLMGAVFAEPPAETPPLSVTEPLEGAPSDKSLVLVRMLFVADKEIQHIDIFDKKGVQLQSLKPDAEGMVVSERMTPGQYQAVTEQGRTEFTLHENASVSVESGCGWSDGEQIHLTSKSVGSVTVRRIVGSGEATDGWLDYTLSDDVYESREVIWRIAGAKELTCTFYGVPYGNYILAENGVACGEVSVSADAPDLEIIVQNPA